MNQKWPDRRFQLSISFFSHSTEPKSIETFMLVLIFKHYHTRWSAVLICLVILCLHLKLVPRVPWFCITTNRRLIRRMYWWKATGLLIQKPTMTKMKWLTQKTLMQNWKKSKKDAWLRLWKHPVLYYSMTTAHFNPQRSKKLGKYRKANNMRFELLSDFTNAKKKKSLLSVNTFWRLLLASSMFSFFGVFLPVLHFGSSLGY